MGQAPVGSSYNDAGEGYALLAGAGDFGDITPEPKKYTTKPTRVSKQNDLILCIRATIGDLNWSDIEYCLGRGVAGLRPIDGKLDKNYLWHFISSNNGQLESKGTGSTFKQVNRSHIEEWEIPLPPFEEQKRIATILDKADAIRRKRQQAIYLTDQLLRSVFLDMFGDPLTNSKGMSTAKLSDVGEIITGNTPARKKPDFYGDYIEWIKSDNINTPSHYLTKAEEYLSQQGFKVGRSVPENSILVTCIAGSKDCIGNVALADRTVAFNQQINAIIPNKTITTLFLYAQICFNKKLVQRASTESMKGLVSKSKFSDIEILLPDRKEQEKYVDFFIKTIRKIKRVDESKIKADELFNGLAQQAFRGELSKQTKAA